MMPDIEMYPKKSVLARNLAIALVMVIGAFPLFFFVSWGWSVVLLLLGMHIMWFNWRLLAMRRPLLHVTSTQIEVYCTSLSTRVVFDWKDLLYIEVVHYRRYRYLAFHVRHEDRLFADKSRYVQFLREMNYALPDICIIGFLLPRPAMALLEEIERYQTLTFGLPDVEYGPNVPEPVPAIEPLPSAAKSSKKRKRSGSSPWVTIATLFLGLIGFLVAIAIHVNIPNWEVLGMAIAAVATIMLGIAGFRRKRFAYGIFSVGLMTFMTYLFLAILHGWQILAEASFAACSIIYFIAVFWFVYRAARIARHYQEALSDALDSQDEAEQLPREEPLH
jgi:hypothetical protein